MSGEVQRFAELGETVVVVKKDGDLIGAIAVSTPLRPEAAAAIAHLRSMGLSAVVLSGDSSPAVQAVAAKLGIEDARSGLSASQKVDAIQGVATRRATRADGRRRDQRRACPRCRRYRVRDRKRDGRGAREQRDSPHGKRPRGCARRGRPRTLDRRQHPREPRLGDGIQHLRAASCRRRSARPSGRCDRDGGVEPRRGSEQPPPHAVRLVWARPGTASARHARREGLRSVGRYPCVPVRRRDGRGSGGLAGEGAIASSDALRHLGR